MTVLALRALAAAGLILVTWVAQIALWVGIGLAARRALTREGPDPDELPLTAWYGFALCLLALQIWHLWLPITGATTLALAGIGVAGLWVHRGRVASLIRGIGRTRWHAPAALALVWAGWLATEAAAPCCTFDTGLYQRPFVEWAHAHAIVPGLANLFANLGFNSSGLLYAAAVDTGPWAGLGSHVAFGAATLLLTAIALWSAVRWWRTRSARPIDVFRTALLAPASALAAGGSISSYETDMIAGTLLLAGAAEAYAVLSGVRGDHRSRAARVHMAVVILAAVATLKLTNLVLAVGLATGLLWLHARSASGVAGRHRFVALTAAGAGLLIGTWALRGGILSGYPFYPSRTLSLPVEWRAPAAQAEGTRLWIRHAGRTAAAGPEVVGDDDFFGSTRWIGPALERTFLRMELDHGADGGTAWMTTIPIFLTLLVAPGLRLARLRDDPLAWFLPSIAVTLVLWFVTAPAGRFALSTCWTLAACVLAARARSGSRLPLPAWTGAVGLGALGAAVVVTPVVDAWIRDDPVAAARAGFLTRPPVRGLYGRAPGPPHVIYTTDSGLELVVPAGDRMLCADAPRPCTPHPQPGLFERDPGNPAAGFVVRGAWRPERWPNTWRAHAGRSWSAELRERYPPRD